MSAWKFPPLRAGNSLRGFTLIEMVIALVLMTFVMLGLVSALFSFGQSMTTMDNAVERIEDQRTLQNFLTNLLSTTLAAGVNTPSRTGIFFTGAGQELEWVAPMPPRPGMGGVSFMHLFVRQNGATPELVYQTTPYTGANELPQWANEPVRSLVSIDNIKLEYQEQEGSEWLPAWSDANRLPVRIRLSIASQDRIWPPIVAQLTSVDPISGLINGVVR